ncbi:copper transporter 1-like protein [Cinnamomum micranthum f. kanehirae]|uniref:Copper transport protein n=1 Tax=Cinnamomum micranthum f. kanehirae TaxID=337451 RepID=A0A3S3NTF3_9MAGN|nr:copper transporter 1-like protein [Cinnamomum micranthum f. kanehirae]
MYVILSITVFMLAVLIEWLSHAQLMIQPRSTHVASAIEWTSFHVGRVALAYALMLLLMPFDIWVFLLALAGHSFGFLLFGGQIFESSKAPDHGLQTCNPAVEAAC